MGRSHRELADHRPGLSPPQFSLRFLLVAMALLGGLITIAMRSGPIGAFVGAIAVLSIFAHVASTAIGSQLRRGRRAPPESSVEGTSSASASPEFVQPMEAEPEDFAPATELSHRAALNRRPVIIAMATGATLAALLGGAILTIVMWEDFSIVNILFGAFSSAIIGAMFGFWLSSFFQVVSSAVSQAQKDATK